jgi:hypothetical protein
MFDVSIMISYFNVILLTHFGVSIINDGMDWHASYYDVSMYEMCYL